MGVAVGVALLTDVDRRASFVRTVVLNAHLATAAATDGESLQERGPFAGDASAAVAIPILA
jgi:hypothetical protein